MTVETNSIAACHRLFLLKDISASDAKKLWKLLGSREELLAHFVLTERVLAKYPKAQEKITRVAEHNSIEAATPRKIGGDILGQKRASETLEHSIRSAIDASLSQVGMHDAVLRAQASYELMNPEGHSQGWRPKR